MGGGNLLKGKYSNAFGQLKKNFTRKNFAYICEKSDSENNKKLFGFTLAEVLITLGIIGIVAAITLPTLMAKIQRRVLKQQYKEAFSMINQSLRQVYYNNDYIPECYYGVSSEGFVCLKYDEKGRCIAAEGGLQGYQKECSLLMSELKKTLKVSHECEKNAYKKGCIPKYKGLENIYQDRYPDDSDEQIADKTFGCNLFRQNSILNNSPAWTLLNGTIIGFPNGNIKIFYFDVNGKKGPNRWGYDVFAGQIKSDGNKLFIDEGGCSMREKGGLSGRQMLQ